MTSMSSKTHSSIKLTEEIRQRSSPPSAQPSLHELIPLDPQTERRLLHKLDWRIVPWIFLLYFLSVEDRVNVGFSFTMNKQQGHDLATTAHLSARENNIGLGLFYVAYILFEVPSNMIMAHVNPAYWIARIMITWSIVTCCMAVISQAWHFYLLRFLLGVFEAGFWPGIAYYTTLWYRPEEISSRIGIMYLAGPASGAFGGLISAGIQLIDMRGNLYGWQWLFLISGLLSLVFGIATLFILPAKPGQSKGFLTQEEAQQVQQRIQQPQQQQPDDNNGKSNKKIVMMRDLRNLKSQLVDYKVWLFCVLYFTPVMAATSLGYFLPKIVQQIDTYSSIQVSLMSIPPYVFGGLMVFIITRLSDRFRDRGWFIIAMCITSFVGFVILSFTKSVGARYFGLMIVAGGTYPTVPLSMAWTANSKEDAVAVASATGIVSSVANFGALICTFALYSGWEADAPNFVGSNMVVGSAMLLAAISAAFLKFRLNHLNGMIDSGIKVGNGGRDYRYLL
ncbi:major facilitator superfamily domain-containing protein [Chlamydoabsidia padenii]|nr:major facilitator superfamily domain-containing protein [Chlamydoabsidia padenii]